MNELDLISRQLRREIEQGEEGRHRISKATREAEGRQYSSSTVYGRKLLKTATGLVAARMADTLKHAAKGRGGADFAVAFKYLKDQDPEIMAVLTLKVCLDVLGQEKSPTLIQLTAPIGAAIEVEQRLRWYRSQDKDLYSRVTKNFHKGTGTGQKASVYRLQFNRAGIKWKAWGTSVHHKVGAWALRAVIETTGWIEKNINHQGKKKITIMRYSQEFLGLRGAILERAEELAYCLWPMLCPPNEWTQDHPGGYLTEEIRGTAPMIRKAGPIPASKQGTLPITFLNKLQAQAYRINRKVLEVADWCLENSRTVGKFIREEHQDPPTRPAEGASEEVIEAYKHRRRQIEDHNSTLSQVNWRTTETMWVANRYRDEERFWIPWSFDYRGRVYPQNTQLNPQGTDFDKALLYFSDEGSVNEYWLAWHVATTYGYDKLSHDDRVQWTRDNLALITRVAEDPIGNILLWENPDKDGNPQGEPWSFLAAAIEYHACVITGVKKTSGLPIGIDATCSGLQHLSSMTLDRTAAIQVNVVRGPEDKPSDGYRAVAQASLKYIDDKEIHPAMDRKVTKRTVMTVPYGVSRDKARDYIRTALKNKVDLSVKGRLGQVVDAVYHKAVPEVFKGPVDVMKWLQKQVPTLLEKGDTIEWITPSGFHVIQDIRKSKTKRIETMLMGSVVRCEVGDGWAGPDPQRHKGAIAPNFVHSLDASLLHLLFTDTRWTAPFTVIHDCILGRSAEMDQLMSLVREHHAEIYKGSPLVDWARQQGIPEDEMVNQDGEPLMKGTLDLDDVNDSPYFFC